MRRSLTIQLTLLPLLASAAIASADPPGATAPLPPDEPADAQLIIEDPHALRPPGMTASIDPDCFQDPDQWKCRVSGDGAVVRGGFGHYFGTGGG